MTTITGTLENTSGSPVHCRVTFKSKSTPLVSGGIVIGATTKTLKTDPTDGSFSVVLAAGKYDVTYATIPDATKFEITVPEGDDTVTIGSVTSSSLIFTSVAPNTVWNGVRQGHITFDPVDDPAQPPAATVSYTGGHVTNETYAYAITYITAEGETALSPQRNINPGVVTNKAIRITLATGVSRVTSKRIWRTISSDTSGQMFLLATVAPSVASYDDWESHADFSGRASSPPATPAYNTTAGIIYAKAGQQVLYFSTSGLRVLSNIAFDGVITTVNAGIRIDSGGINWGNTSGALTNTGGASFNDNVQIGGGATVSNIDVVFTESGIGPVLMSPTAGNYRLRVNNAGVVFTEHV